MRVVQQPIEHRRRHRRVAGKRCVPLRERHVARDDDRTALIPLRDRLEEMAGLIAREWEISDLVDIVDNEQLRPLYATAQKLLEPPPVGALPLTAA